MFRRSRFATALHSAPRLLATGLLIALGALLGMRLVRRPRPPMPRSTAPEIDRWANEGGAVVTPAFPLPNPKPTA